MKRGIIAAVLLGGVWAVGSAYGFYLDEDRTIMVTGKVFTQAAWRMEDSDSSGRACQFGKIGTGQSGACEGWTFPDTRRGQLIQHRYAIDAEVYHDLARWLGPGFDMLDQFGYRIRAKWFYDGLYDYGPHQFRNGNEVIGMANAFDPSGVAATDGHGLIANRRQNSTGKNALWNAYVDVARGPMKFRIGRQDLSWGESDGFRLLDHIAPLDNRFGFPLVEDLDERRIPLWMVRPTWSIGTMGVFRNLTVDGFWVPGTIDNEVSPVSPPGNPFGVAAPPGEAIIVRPSKTLGNSRGGARLIGTVGPVTFSIGNYVTFNDVPSNRLFVRGLGSLPMGSYSLFAPDAAFLVEFYKQQITGGSATFALPFDPYTIVRMEAAHFWDERVFIASQSVDAAVNQCFGQAPPCAGELPTRNIMRWMIGLDRNVWLRWLNPENTFYMSAQYFHTNIFNYDSDIANALPSRTQLVDVPAEEPTKALAFTFVPRRNDEITFTYVVNTLLRHGTIQPQVFGLYDTRGVHGLVPSISYQWGTNVVLTMKYAFTFGNYTNLGFFRDRDQLLFRVQYNLS